MCMYIINLDECNFARLKNFGNEILRISLSSHVIIMFNRCLVFSFNESMVEKAQYHYSS